MFPWRRYQQTFPIWFRALLFVIVAPGAAAVLIPWLLLSMGWEWERLNLGPLRWVGAPFLLIGTVAYLPCVREFVVRGRGTPSPFDPPKKLVTSGTYRFVRNPMYVTVGLFLIGEILVFESLALLLFLLLLWLDFHLFVLFYEEPTLRKSFGESYEAYCRAVRRWVPRLRPYRPEEEG